MGEVIGTILQKGGSAKTTTTVNLGSILAKEKKRTLIIDMDPQGNAGMYCGYKLKVLRKLPTIFDVFKGEASIKDVIRKGEGGVYVIPANINLAEFDLWAVLDARDKKEPQNWLRDAIAPIRDKFEYLLIDCPPSLSFLTINAMTAADSVLIPVECEYFAEVGLDLLLNTITRVKREFNPKLVVRGIVYTKFVRAQNLSTTVANDVNLFAEKIGIPVYGTRIRRSVKLGESALENKPAVIVSPRNEAVLDYFELAKEMFGVG